MRRSRLSCLLYTSQKTVSIRAINTSSTWQLESAEDVRRCVAELQDRLMKALEEDTVVNIEF